MESKNKKQKVVGGSQPVAEAAPQVEVVVGGEEGPDPGRKKDAPPEGTELPRKCPHEVHCDGCAFNTHSAVLSDFDIGFNGCCGRPACRANPVNPADDYLAGIFVNTRVTSIVNGPAAFLWDVNRSKRCECYVI